MLFSTFLLYFLASTLISKGILFSVYLVRMAYLKRKLTQAIKNGNIQMVSMDDILGVLKDEDKKTWN